MVNKVKEEFKRTLTMHTHLSTKEKAMIKTKASKDRSIADYVRRKCLE